MKAKHLFLLARVVISIGIVFMNPLNRPVLQDNEMLGSIVCTKKMKEKGIFEKYGLRWQCIDRKGLNGCKKIGLFPNQLEDCLRCCQHGTMPTKIPESLYTTTPFRTPTVEFKTHAQSQNKDEYKRAVKGSKHGYLGVGLGTSLGFVAFLIILAIAIPVVYKQRNGGRVMEADNEIGAVDGGEVKEYAGLSEGTILFTEETSV